MTRRYINPFGTAPGAEVSVINNVSFALESEKVGVLVLMDQRGVPGPSETFGFIYSAPVAEKRLFSVGFPVLKNG